MVQKSRLMPSKSGKYRKCMPAVKQRATLGVVCSYCMVSVSADLVVVGIFPIDLLVQELKQVYKRKAEVGRAQRLSLIHI